MTLLVVLTLLVLLAGALATLMLRDLLAAVAASAIVSLALAVLMALLGAPDVALAEAVVGSGLSGVMFAMTLRRVRYKPADEEGSHASDPS